MVRRRPTAAPRRRRLLRAGAAALATGLAGCPGGGTTPEESPSAGQSPDDSLSVTSSAFEAGDTIPTRYTCDGENVSPPLTVANVPEGAGSLAVIVDDPDAPGGTFVHWLLWNVPPDRTQLPAGVTRGETVADLGGARQGENDANRVGYSGPCPPTADDAHTYRFTAYAVEGTLDLQAGADRAALADALDGRTLTSERLTGEFDR